MVIVFVAIPVLKANWIINKVGMSQSVGLIYFNNFRNSTRLNKLIIKRKPKEQVINRRSFIIKSKKERRSRNKSLVRGSNEKIVFSGRILEDCTNAIVPRLPSCDLEKREKKFFPLTQRLFL